MSVTLGKFLGEGSYGSVYQLKDNKSLVAKIINFTGEQGMKELDD